MKQWLVLLTTLATVVFSEASAWADRVSGVLTRTYVVVEDTDLVGDVTCNVGSNPCFSFGASDVELRLNGFTITGQADPVTACRGATFAGEAGILTNGMNNVTVRGPGLVQRFRRWGVHVGGGSTNVRIDGITASTNCASRVGDGAAAHAAGRGRGGYPGLSPSAARASAAAAQHESAGAAQ